MKPLIKGRTLKYGSNAVVSSLIVLAILVVINLLGAKYHHRYDATKERLYSLSDQTISVLSALKRDVKVTAFFKEEDAEKSRFQDLMKEYRYRSSKLSYDFVDPDKTPSLAKRYDIRNYGTTVVESGNKEEKIEETTEKALTNAIVKVTREKNKAIYFTQGHGERSLEAAGDRDGYSTVRDRLKESNYDVKTLVLAQEGRIPDDCDVLVVAAPQTPFFSIETTAIGDYLNKGGHAFLLLEPVIKTGLEDPLRSWGIDVGDDFVLDFGVVGQLFGIRDRTVPVVTEYGNHDITKKLQGIMTFYPLVRSVSLMKDLPSGTTGTELVKTTAQSWAEHDITALTTPGTQVSFDAQDKKGPISLAVAATADAKTGKSGAKGRLIVFGDADFANNQFFGQQGNGDLFMNSINWLAEEEDLIAIAPKEPGHRPISLTQKDASVIFWISIVLLPFGTFIAGIIVWWKRR